MHMILVITGLHDDNAVIIGLYGDMAVITWPSVLEGMFCYRSDSPLSIKHYQFLNIIIQLLHM